MWLSAHVIEPDASIDSLFAFGSCVDDALFARGI
jgi:hypothetical protein